MYAPRAVSTVTVARNRSASTLRAKVRARWRPFVSRHRVRQALTLVQTELGDERLDGHDALTQIDRVEAHGAQERGPCRLDA
jgi:hypothetical protein